MHASPDQAPPTGIPSKPRSPVPALLAIAVGLLVLGYAVPRVVWRLGSSKPLAVLLLDKTVPRDDYREHRGLIWLLNHHKYVTAPDGEPFGYATDYFGFVQRLDSASDTSTAHVMDGPHGRYRTRPVAAAASGRYDLIYLADTYGVYTSDYDTTRGVQPRLIYGGLEEEELRLVEQELRRGTTLIAEFNTLARPTPPARRARLSTLLGITWTGWSGRYFDDLTRGREVPDWAIAGYETEAGPWVFRGPGFVFGHEDGRVLVLEQGRDIQARGLRIEFPADARRAYGVKDQIPYFYWFDIVVPQATTQVLAWYQLDLRESGQALLSRAGLSARFPAILHDSTGSYESYYFAGDFADRRSVPSTWESAGMARLYRYLPATAQASEDAFYWKVYVPLMRTILGRIVRR